MRFAFAIALACLMASAQQVEDAWTLIRAGQSTQAVEVLRHVIAANPRNADARLLLGSILQEEGNREALEHLKEAVHLRPESAEAHNALGEALNTFGESSAARPEFETAVRLDPKFAQAYVNLGLVLLQAHQLDQAAKSLDHALELMPAGPDAAYPHYLRAKIDTERGQSEKASAQLKQAVSLRPDFAEAWSDLGQARKALLDDASALAAFERAVQLSSSDVISQTRLGAEYFDQGKLAPAVEHLREAVRLDPRNQTALYKLQLALRQSGNAEEANAVKRQLADVLLANDKQSQNALLAIQKNNRGAALEKAGDLRGALEQYGAALQLNPEHVGIRLNLAAVLLRLGQRDDGVAELRRVLRRDPGNAGAKRALEEALARRP